MKKEIKFISAATFFYLLVFGTFAVGEEMGKHSNEMMTDQEKGMGKHSKDMMMMDARTGMLEGAEGHKAAGKVSIVHIEKGKTLLRLSSATIDKVPDGRVYLAKDGDYQKGVELGKLKKFSGDLEFKIPHNVDTEDYNSVVVWCKKFNVEIGRASLESEMMKK
ncbi:MAG TPA: DM13 domain-containing protein [Nitrospiria bacterium]|jgi:hypothetical protein